MTADAIDADLGIFGFAIPNAPVQPLDLGDDRRFCRFPGRIIGRQGTGNLLQVLQPHGDVKPVEHRRLIDAGIGENAPEARAAVGEGGQRRILGGSYWVPGW